MSNPCWEPRQQCKELQFSQAIHKLGGTIVQFCLQPLISSVLLYTFAYTTILHV